MVNTNTLSGASCTLWWNEVGANHSQFVFRQPTMSTLHIALSQTKGVRGLEGVRPNMTKVVIPVAR